jgi:hypothetical protein
MGGVNPASTVETQHIQNWAAGECGGKDQVSKHSYRAHGHAANIASLKHALGLKVLFRYFYSEGVVCLIAGVRSQRKKRQY